jgi:hypothetical protein
MDENFLNELNKEKNQEDKKNQIIEDLAKECKTLSNQNKAILSTLNDFKPELGGSSLKMLQNVLNGVQNVNIPSEISLSKTQKIEFADTTRKWLLIFFSCSLFVVVGALGFAWWAYQYEYKPKEELKINDQQTEWLIDYVDYMKEKNPNSHTKFMLQNSFPE